MRRDSMVDVLRSGLGRRILGMFMLATLLPVIFTALLSYNEVVRGLKTEVAKTLKEDAKSYGVDLLERLNYSAERARIFDTVIASSNKNISEHEYLTRDFDAVWMQSGGVISKTFLGKTATALPYPSINYDHLQRGKPQLIWLQKGSANVAFLALKSESGPDRQALIFQLNQDRIWGDSENLPYATQFCVYAPANIMGVCTEGLEIPASARDELLGRRSDVPVALDSYGQDYLASSWELFLDSTFSAPSIEIIAAQSELYALRSGADYRRIFIPALALVVLLVGFLSLNLIARSITPLNRLNSLARQFAGGDLKSRIRLHTNDEFQELGETFNYMAGQLHGQFGTMKAMSQIDRLILDGAKLEEVGEKVIHCLIDLIDCKSAGIIARDDDSPAWAKMISGYQGECFHERVAIPQSEGNEWCQPRQVEIGLMDPADAPYKARFEEFGHRYVVIIPVVLEDDIKGILLLGDDHSMIMSKGVIQRCVDLAGRLAVALASAEREGKLYRQAHYDDLTGLPNRQLLKDRLHQQIVQTKREERSGALLFLDLDRFKEINDVYGHSVGDVVLKQAAGRIVAEVRDTDTVARLGGDEFVVVLPSVHNEASIGDLANRILKSLSIAFSVGDEQHFVSASIGIVVFPDDGNSVETLLKNADAAMYRAKDGGRSRFEFFSEKLNVESRRKIMLERELRDAHQNGDLEVHFQPQFDLCSGVICGAEALLRWNHAKDGFISPAEFVPLAEDSGLIGDIGRWVLEETCLLLKSILDVGLHPGPVSVNVSGMQIRDTQFVDDVLSPLRRHGIHPAFIQLEITETAVAQSREMAVNVLNKLRGEGVQVAIDDFGTGYSSLSYLQQLPFDLIKIDGSFVAKIGSGDNSDQICRTIIRMAHELGKPAIAEGVENHEQERFLRENECDSVQGFLYSEALSPEEFVRFIEKQDFHTQRRKALELI